MQHIRRTLLAALAALASSRAFGAQKEKPMGKKGYSHTSELPGGRNEYQSEGMSDTILSTDVTAFEFQSPEFRGMASSGLAAGSRHAFHVSAVRLASGALRITSRGGNTRHRDGSAFRLDYEAQDLGFMAELSSIVRRHRLSLDNGHVLRINGLPPGYGDTLSVTYASGERIYKSSNQTPTVPHEAANAIYEAFRRKAEQSGHGFSTEQSTEALYDDPTEDYLQGAWSGKHFGRVCRAVFTGRHVVITYDGEVIDDTDYVIAEGAVVPDRLRATPAGEGPRHRYESFKGGLSSFGKVNGFTLGAYFYNGRSSSSCQLLKEK